MGQENTGSSSGVGGGMGNGPTAGGAGRSSSASESSSAGTLVSGGRTASGETSGGLEGGIGEALSAVQNRVDSLMERGAETVEQAADRIGRFASSTSKHSGIVGRTGGVAQGAADVLDTVSRYLRDNDAMALQEDLMKIVERRPLQSMLVAVAAGWVVGKVLR